MEENKIECNLSDSTFRQMLANQYKLDPEKDIELLQKLHEMGSILNVFNGKFETLDSMIEYATKLKDLIVSKEYQQMDTRVRANFEVRVLRILKNLYVKGVGSEYFVIEPYKTRFNVSSIEL